MNDRCAFISPDGHYQTMPQGEQQLVYVVQRAAGQELLTPKEFAKYGWKNDPSNVKLPSGGHCPPRPPIGL